MNPLCLVSTTVAFLLPASPAGDLPTSIADAVSAKLASRLGEPVKGHDNLVVDVELSPDGALALSAGWDGAIKVWDAKNGKELRALTGHDELLYWAHFTAGGKRIVSGAMDKTIRVWDVRSGNELARLETEQTMQVSAISPDGRWLAASSPEEKVVMLYDLEKSCEPAGELPHEAKGILLNLAFSSDGKRLASAGMFDDFVQVHDVAKREVLFTEPAPFGVSALAWSPDGESLYLGGNDDVVQWGIAGKEVLEGMGGHEETTHGLSVSEDGSIVYFGDGSGAVRGWNLAAGEQVFFAGEHRDTVADTALSPDSKLLLSGSHDGTVRFWDVATERETLVPPGHTNLVQEVAWSADGARLLSGCLDNSACLWDVKSGKLLQYATAHDYAVVGTAFVGEHCVTAGQDNTVRFFDAKGAEVEARRIDFGEDVPPMMAMAAHGGRALVGFGDGSLRIVDLKTGETLASPDAHEDAIVDVAWSPNGERLASVAWDGCLRVFDAAGRTLFADSEGGEEAPVAVAFLDDLTVLVADGAGDVAARSVEGGKAKWSFGLGEEGWVEPLAVAPDGKTFAMACSDGLAFHDVATGERRFAVTTPDGSIGCLTFSPDGKVLAAGLLDSTVLLWRVDGLEAAK